MAITFEERSSNLNILNNFIGYGNPDAEYLFVGIEEHSYDNNSKDINWESEHKRFDIYKNNFFNKPFSLSNTDFNELNHETGKSPTYEGITKIYNHLNKGERLEIKDIGKLSSNLFIMNLYPLGRATTKDKYNDFVKEYLFNGDFEEWYNDNWMPSRKNVLVDFLKNYFQTNKNTKKWVFCLGTSLWYEFEDLLKSALEDPQFKFEIKQEVTNNTYFGLSEKTNSNIFCLYHPASSHFRKLDIQNILDVKNNLENSR